MPFIESPIPKSEPEDYRRGDLITFDSLAPNVGPFTNKLYEHAHRMMREQKARCRFLPGPASRHGKALDILILLDTPAVGLCERTGQITIFEAAILREFPLSPTDRDAGHAHGAIEGWLVSDHQSALATWREQHPGSLA